MSKTGIWKKGQKLVGIKKSWMVWDDIWKYSIWPTKRGQRPKLTLEVTSKTCQNDFKLHTCGWFWMIFENNQSDPPKEVRGQISSQTIHLQKNITESNCRHQIEFWKSRRVSITANSGKKLAKTKNLENNTITQQILDWPYFLHLVKIWGSYGQNTNLQLFCG